VSTLDAELGLHEDPAQLTPQYLEELLDELDIRMAVRVVDPSEPPVPVGRFEAVMYLGSGGYGCVVEAWDPNLERAVALKLCVNDKPAATELLLAEAKTLARLQHPNIITVHETGRYHESLFLVMEFASGGSLTRRALEAERMSWRRLVPIFANVARGLAAAHDAGVTHGDLKPSNILLHGDGRPCIADFGLARIIGAAPLLPDAIGTLLYAAPEVLDGGEPDPLSDQWSLFVTLWECLDRRLPFVSNKELKDKLLELSGAGMLWLIRRWPGPSTLRSDVPESLREIWWSGSRSIRASASRVCMRSPTPSIR
jgi:serine/threonine protein kinase